MHWINVVGLTILVMSGLNIFSAHPALYWGKSSYTGSGPALQIEAHRSNGHLVGITRAFGREFVTTGVLGAVAGLDGRATARTFPSWLTFRGLSSRTQITRHDCVEGWSAIGKWKGARLAALLEIVRPTAQARYVVFYCADPKDDDGSSTYYESIDLDEALHPQTILAYELNDQILPIPNGAPLRLRVERQFGYKHAKYVMRIELVENFDRIRGGKGGYWEDQGYEWWAGI